MRRYRAILFFVALSVCLTAGAAVAQTLQNVELHGYMLNRMYTNPDSSARFVTERVSLSAVGQIGKDSTGYIEVYLHPYLTDSVIPGSKSPNDPPLGYTAEQGRTYLESAYFDTPFANGRIRIGKGRQLNFGMTPSYPNRKTTQYGILSELFTQDRIQGFQYTYSKKGLDAGASLFTDLRIGNRKIGDFANVEASKVVPHFAERDDSANSSGRMMMTAKIGVTRPSWNAHVSGGVGKLHPNDANFIVQQYHGSAATTSNRDHNKWGLDAMYTKGRGVLQGEYYQGTFSDLDIKGYSMTAGYQPKDKLRAYVRYAAINNGETPLANPYTWDTRQLTVGLVQPIKKGVWAEFQYERNMENPPAGTADVDNDMLFVEFFTGF